MKNFKKVIALLMAALTLVSLVACSNDKGSDETNGGSQGNVNTSSEIYEFTINIFGDTYALPAEFDEFKCNGWTYASNDNPESKDVNGNGYATCDVLKDGIRITLTVINMSASTKKFAECKVGSIDCTFSAANDVTLNLPKKLSAKKSTTSQDVIDKWGEATKTITEDSGTTLRYENFCWIMICWFTSLYLIGADRAVNYNADSRGTEVLFETVSDTVCCMRQSQPLSTDWSKKINEDYNNRK